MLISVLDSVHLKLILGTVKLACIGLFFKVITEVFLLSD